MVVSALTLRNRGLRVEIWNKNQKIKALKASKSKEKEDRKYRNDFGTIRRRFFETFAERKRKGECGDEVGWNWGRAIIYRR